jgi:hypothetical protein
MDNRPVHALLSQLIVAYTVEADNEFERRMRGAGFRGIRHSLTLWLNILRFLAGEPSLREIGKAALLPNNSAAPALGCLERWHLVTFGAGRRAGFGSGRGLRADSVPRLTPFGRLASEIWPLAIAEVESRWQHRFGTAALEQARQALGRIADSSDRELPQALPLGWEPVEFPPRFTPPGQHLPLISLLSQVLLMFRLEFDRASRVPLIFCANTIRVLSEEPVPEASIPLLTGCSPETSGIGWQIKPFLVVAPAPGGRRGKAVWLSPRGLLVQEGYRQITAEIESRWEAQFGDLSPLLRAFFPRLAEGLTPPPGTIRAGAEGPSLGRASMGPAARQRMRDLVAQTEAFVADPAGALPHYPMWDMNRGFGP